MILHFEPSVMVVPIELSVMAVMAVLSELSGMAVMAVLSELSGMVVTAVTAVTAELMVFLWYLETVNPVDPEIEPQPSIDLNPPDNSDKLREWRRPSAILSQSP